MMDSSEPPAPLRAQVVVYENERHWIGGGFSKKGLLLTERGPFSTNDGSLSFKTIEHASKGLLGKGWQWEEADVYGWDCIDAEEERAHAAVAASATAAAGDGDDNDAVHDAAVGLADDKVRANKMKPSLSRTKKSGGGAIGTLEGWRYSADFSATALQKASTKKSPLHFVRRRRLVRHRVFNASQFLRDEIRLQCDHCDSETINDISQKLLEVLSIATLLQTDVQHNLTDAAGLKLKEKLIEELHIGGEVPPYLLRVDSQTRIRSLCNELDKFPHKTTSILSKTSMFNRSEVGREGLSDRMGEIAARFMCREERDELAKLVIRHLDTPDFVLHCPNRKCGEACEFCPTKCPNVGCDVCESRKYMAHHQASCGYKIVDCSNRCGKKIARNKMKIHLSGECELRDASCPFRGMGCPAVVLAKDCPQHLADGAGAHLLLVAAKMDEHNEQISNMQMLVKKLQFENASLKQQILQSNADRKRDIEAIQKELNKVKKEAALAHKEAGKLGKSVRQLKKK